MNKIRQQDNKISVVQKGIPTYFSCTALATETSGLSTPFQPTTYRRITKPCVLVFFVPSDEITYHCDDLTDIDDVIAKYTSTEKGKKALQKAEEELHKELHQQVMEGKLNRVKYYRLINNMDQKTLAKLSGIKQPNISRIEKLDYTADTDTYKKIAKGFKINYKELLP